MPTILEKIIGQEKALDCIARIQELVGVWMQDNDIHSWEDLASPNEFEVTDEDYHFKVCSGATKIVLVPDNLSYVIKIPYYGEETWEGYVYPFNGGIEGKDMDYCAEEAEIYADAETFGCAQFFVPMVYLTMVGDIPIYIQTKINAIRTMRPSNENAYRYASIHNSEFLDPEVGGRLVQYYSTEEIAIFLTFLKKHNINDLEGSRNGEYVKSFGRYVFWDYCGYHEENWD